MKKNTTRWKKEHEDYEEVSRRPCHYLGGRKAAAGTQIAGVVASQIKQGRRYLCQNDNMWGSYYRFYMHAFPELMKAIWISTPIPDLEYAA